MNWQDEGIILHTQNLGEGKKIINLFTPTHGRCAGVFRESKKTKGWLQCGRKVNAYWKGRLETHLGQWSLEPLPSPAAFLLDLPGPLSALLSVTSLCQVTLPEHHVYEQLYENLERLLNDLSSPTWMMSYVFFELTLLRDLGYGLALEACTVTGTTKGLVAVSPRTGRAVCEEVSKPYKGRLLPLPPFLRHENKGILPSSQEILDGLYLTGYFLERYLLGRPLPSARERLYRWLSKAR